MRVLRVFFLGVLFGWLMKWIIDEVYMKEELRFITDENLRLKERIQSMEVKSVRRVTPAPAAVPAPAPAEESSRKDDLRLIKGIGPQSEKKLNNAGIDTFAQLSRLTTTDLRNILGLSKRATQNADNLITQAKKFAQQKTRNK